jgi:hypothetical protein
MSNLALLLFEQVNEKHLGPYNPGASEWWAWVGAACFLVGIVGFSIMGLRAKEKGRGHFAHKILIVLVAMTSYIARPLRKVWKGPVRTRTSATPAS